MWPFATRGARYADDSTTTLSPQTNLHAFRTNDASIKLWLPEKLVSAIDVLCKSHDASRPDILRWVLFEHLYGRVEFEFLRRSVNLSVGEPEIQFSPRAEPKPKFSSRRDVNNSYLGKATEDIKLWMPSVMKADLELAAASSASFFSSLMSRGKVPLSDYIRAVLARHLFGERFFVEWQDALAAANQMALTREAA